MVVKVGNRLLAVTADVGDEAIPVLCDPRILGDDRYDAVEIAQRLAIFRFDSLRRLDVALRNDEDVHGALGAVAETGSVIVGSAEGRRHQLLPPTHLAFIPQHRVFGTLAEALTELKGQLPSAIALHSGPSKSADIGQVMVRGVHGPGRLIAAIIAWEG